MNQYPISKTYKVIGLLFAAAAIIGGTCLLYLLSTPASSPAAQTARLIFGLILLPLGYWAYRESLRLRVTVDEENLVVEHAFSSRSIGLDDIDGYRVGDKDAFFIIPRDGGKSVQVPGGLQGRSDLLDWIREKYQDVDARERAAETEQLLEDDHFGSSREEREGMLRQATRLGQMSHATGFALCLWAFVYPKPFETAMIASLVAPVIGGFLTWRYKGLMRLNTRKSSPYPSAVLLMTMPLVGAGVTILRGYDLYDFPSSAWSVLIVGTFVLTFIATSVFRAALAAETNKIVTIGVIVFFAAVYSYDLLLFSNCHYDRSDAQVWPVRIESKHINHGSKSDSYYLSLTRWAKYSDGKDVEVTRSFYKAVSVDEKISVLLYHGKWGIPWYAVTRSQGN